MAIETIAEPRILPLAAAEDMLLTARCAKRELLRHLLELCEGEVGVRRSKLERLLAALEEPKL